MRIAVDAMGGDYAPAVVTQAVAEALRDIPDVEVLLVGHLDKLSYYLEKHSLKPSSRLELIHADDVVEMNEPSTHALRAKKKSSITVCATLCSEGRASAVVSAGHTGAAVAATKVRMRTLRGVDRPAIASIMPAARGKFILVDAGANTDCTPMNLAQFAVMGEIYSKLNFGLKSPRIGLLSVGTEDVKGNELTKETFKIMSKMPFNFVGNVEGHDVFNKVCDVVVCDGFVGNVVLKCSESLAMATFQWMKDAFTKTPMRKTGAILAKAAFKDLKAIGDFEEYGGAPLLGINGVCIIGHGASSNKAVRNAIRVANNLVKLRLTELIAERVEECGVASSGSSASHVAAGQAPVEQPL
jgi:glycerol-3-phosphate acyltransferase PlsX